MSHDSRPDSQDAVERPEERGVLGTVVSLVAKAVGVLVALAILASVTVKDPVWVTQHILIPIFGQDTKVPQPVGAPPSREFEGLYQSIQERDIGQTIQHLAGLQSRVPGYPGAERGVEYLKSLLVGAPCLVTERDDRDDTRLVERTIQEVPSDRWASLPHTPRLTVEEFDVTVPVDEGARLTITSGPEQGTVVPLHCLWPNGAQTPSLPREGITGPLIDGGQGHLDDLDENVSGAIALMAFNCGQRYINLRMLGVKAIIFYTPDGPGGAGDETAEPAAAMNFSEAQDKMLVVPADIPRYYVKPADVGPLRRALQMDLSRGLRTRPPAERQVRLQARMEWKTVKSQNLIVELPGSAAAFPERPGQETVLYRDFRIVVGTYHDSISVVPALAPGAENAASAAATIEIIKALARWKDRRYTLTFLITGAHFQGMAGINDWLYRHARKSRTFLREIEERDADVVTLTSGETLRGRLVRRRASGVELELDDDTRTRRTIPAAEVASVRHETDLIPFKLFIGLDLSSRSDKVAAFSEGTFTNPNANTDNYRKNALAPYASKLEAYHDEIWQGLVEEHGLRQTPEARYTHARYFNAVTPAKRTWKNFMPTPLGFQHEAVHRVGGAALTLATPDDARPLVDTPLDDWEHLAPNVGNVAHQARTITALLMNAAGDYKFFPESKLELPDDAGRIDGQVVWFDRDVNFFVPKAPVSNALVGYVMNGWSASSCGGVRTFIATQTTSGQPQRQIARQRGVIGDGHLDHDQRTNDEQAGRFSFPVRRVAGATQLEAYAFNDDGRIILAPDLGEEGDKNYPIAVPAAAGRSNTTLVVFPCRAITVLEIVDSRRLSALDSLTVLTPNDAEPQWYGTRFIAAQSTREGRTVPAAVVFVKPDTRFKLFMSTGLYGIKYLLTNADERLLESPPTMREVIQDTAYYERESRGRGYSPDHTVIFDPFYKAARDMWIVDDIRIKHMAYYGIRNERLNRLHEEARVALQAARWAIQRDPPNYAVYVAESRRAWGLEARGYPDVKTTASDSVRGIVFYFMLLLPFSFFCERLLFGFKDIRAKLGGVAGVFAVVFILLHLVHPAFKLTTSPYIILLAFVVLVLGVWVLVVLMRKFGEEVQKSKRASSGLHEVDVGRLSATAAAINLGINNLRKRKVRTTLTAVTLILLTFTVLSFTSIQTSLRPFVLPHPGNPLYDGALIRDRSWRALQDTKLDYIRTTFGVNTFDAVAEVLRTAYAAEPGEPGKPDGGNRAAPAGEPQRGALRTAGASAADLEKHTYRQWRATIVPRAWIQPKVKGDLEFIQITKPTAPPRSTYASGIMGLAPEESAFLDKALDGQAFQKLGLVDADGQPVWFDPHDRDVCFISTHMASEALLDIKPQEVGQVRLRIYGQWFLLKGIFDGDVFDSITDLDGEPLTPVDFVKEASEVTQSQREDPSRQAAQPIRQFDHIPGKNCVIIPYRTARDMGGVDVSIALMDFHLPEGVTPGPEQTWLDAIDHFMDRVALTVFVGNTQKKQVEVWSSLSRTGIGRVGNLLVPIIIAAFIVLNTMIGAVYERAREIGIYSSIGLTPRHIAALFLAESAVFATVGAVVGYLIGQGLVYFLTMVGWLEGSGMVLNYSSLSAIWSTVVVMITTFLSTLYPAKKAAEMAVPDVTRRWKFPEPAGDNWYFDFPFTLGGAEVPGIYTYLARVFESYGEGSVGGFLTEDVRLSARPTARESVQVEGQAPVSADQLGPTYTITMKTWLAPYDLGISQSVRLDAIPTGEANIYRIAMSLVRESGDVASWRRINRGFLNVLRKRFLVWRTMAPGLREEYLAQGQQLTRPAEARV